MDNPINGQEGLILGGLAFFISAYRWVAQIIKDAKSSTDVDAKQNEQIIALKGEISLIKSDVNTLRIHIRDNDTKIANELSKIELKIDKMTDLMMQMLKG